MKTDRRRHAEQEIIKHFLDIVKIAREYNPNDGYFTICMANSKFIHLNNSPDNDTDNLLDCSATMSFLYENIVVKEIDADISEVFE